MKTLNETAYNKLTNNPRYTLPIAGGSGKNKVKRGLDGLVYTYDVYADYIKILTHSQLRGMLYSTHIDPVRKAIIEKELKRVRKPEASTQGIVINWLKHSNKQLRG